jgi:hypothetical protein
MKRNNAVVDKVLNVTSAVVTNVLKLVHLNKSTEESESNERKTIRFKFDKELFFIDKQF